MVCVFIGSLQKTTLTDFPGKVACIAFLVNCNFRCRFCYNKELLSYSNFKKSRRELVEEKDFFEFLSKNKKMLDGVVITGGEPTMTPGLVDFIRKIKSLGFAVKLDTNGTHPAILKKLLDDSLLDYIAMDLKAPLAKYSQVTQVHISPKAILESISLLKSSKIPHEFRTTLYPKLTYEDLKEMALLIPGERWFLQNFQPKKALEVASRRLKPMKNSGIKVLLDEIKGSVDVKLRGID